MRIPARRRASLPATRPGSIRPAGERIGLACRCVTDFLKSAGGRDDRGCAILQCAEERATIDVIEFGVVQFVNVDVDGHSPVHPSVRTIPQSVATAVWRAGNGVCEGPTLV